ncbi:MAG: repeat-containing protein, partial [Phycisphaerales bacterium]|nr:repeat-containing protein [Phycisphaerales bacterium]
HALLILRDNCFSCHNPEKKKGKLVLTSRESALRGNEDGPAFVPDKSDKSLLTKVLAPDADPHMPPKKQLAAEEVAALRSWIDAGAPWDETILAAALPSTRPVQLRALPASYRPILAMALSPDDKRLALGRAGRVFLYDVSGPKPRVTRVLDSSLDVVQSIAWSADGHWLAAGDYRRVSVWEPDSPKAALELGGLTGRVTALAFLPDNRTLLAADGNAGAAARLVRYQLPETEPQAVVAAHADTIFALCCSPDGSLIASGSADKLVKLWQASNLGELARLEGHSGHVMSLTFRRDGLQLASGGADRDVKVWDIKTRQQTMTVGPYRAAVTAIGWGEGAHVFVAGEDGTIHLATAGESEIGRPFPAADDVIHAIAVSSTGKQIFAGGHDGRVYVWNSDGKLESKLDPVPPEADPVAKP